MYSHKQHYNDVLIPQKSTRGRLTQFSATSGLQTAAGNVSLYFNNIQPTSSARMAKNFMFNFTIKKDSSANTVNFDKQPFDFNCLVSINGSITHEVNLAEVFNIYQNYSDRFGDYIDFSKRSFMSKKSLAASEEAHVSLPLLHPLLINGVGQVNSLNIRLSTGSNLASMCHLPAAASCWVSSASITYEEFDIADEDFHIEIPYIVSYNKAYTTTTINSTQSADTRNTTGAPSSVFIQVKENPLTTQRQADAISSRVYPISSLSIDINNNVNAFNAVNVEEIYGRCVAAGSKASFEEFVSSGGYSNAYGAVIRYDITCSDANINTDEIFRCNVRGVKLGAAAVDGAELVVSYLYPAVLHLSCNGGENKIEYIAQGGFVGEIADGVEDTNTLIGGSFFGNIWNAIKGFVRNGGVSKTLDTAGKIAGVLGQDKMSNILSNGKQLSQSIGLSSSIF